MAVYVNNTDCVIRLIDNNDIVEIDLSENKLLKELIVDNCTALKRVSFHIESGSNIIIKNCNALERIENNSVSQKDSSFYLGSGCDSLNHIHLHNMDTVVIENYPLNHLKELYLDLIYSLEINPMLYENLEVLVLYGCNFKNMVTISNVLSTLEIDSCEFESFKHEGENDYLAYLTVKNTNFDEIEFDNYLHQLLELDISNGSDSFPYIPLPTTLYHPISITLDPNTSYDETLHAFIENKRNRVNLTVYDPFEVRDPSPDVLSFQSEEEDYDDYEDNMKTIDDINFY